MEIVLRAFGGFGAIAYWLDRIASQILPGRMGMLARRQPVGVAVAVVVMVLLVVDRVRAAIPYATPLRITPSEIRSLGSEDVYATVAGYLAGPFIVTFPDRNGDGIQQADEDGYAWIYFLGEADGSTGIQVLSERGPDDLYGVTGEVHLTGRLKPRTGVGGLIFRLPDFDVATLPFPLGDGLLHEGAEFPEVGAAIQAALLFGGLAALLVLGRRLEYLPFRAVPPDSIGHRLSILHDRAVRAQVTGVVEINGRVERVRAMPVAVSIAEELGGLRSLLLARGVNDVVDSVSEAQPLVAGEAYGLSEVRHAVRGKGRTGPIVIAFELVSDRDAALEALRTS